MAQERLEDQAARLRNQVEGKNYSIDNQITSYPSRKEIHQNKKKKTKWKLSFSLIRLLLILFIALILMLFTIAFWGDEYLSSMHSNAVTDSIDQMEILF